MRSRCFSGRPFPRKLLPDSLWIHTRHSSFLFRNGLPFFLPAARAPAPAAPPLAMGRATWPAPKEKEEVTP